MISGYVWILPAVTTVGWILSWWGAWRLRLGVLTAAAAVSVLCCIISLQTSKGHLDPAHGVGAIAHLRRGSAARRSVG